MAWAALLWLPKTHHINAYTAYIPYCLFDCTRSARNNKKDWKFAKRHKKIHQRDDLSDHFHILLLKYLCIGSISGKLLYQCHRKYVFITFAVAHSLRSKLHWLDKIPSLTLLLKYSHIASCTYRKYTRPIQNAMFAEVI